MAEVTRWITYVDYKVLGRGLGDEANFLKHWVVDCWGCGGQGKTKKTETDSCWVGFECCDLARGATLD